MPFPRRLARINRRLTNPIVRPAARRLPPLALIHHRGRRSGRAYATPVLAFRSGSTVVVALTYGPDTEWVRNLLAAGGGELEQRGGRHTVHAPRVVPTREVQDSFPNVVRLALRLLRVRSSLRLDGDATGGG